MTIYKVTGGTALKGEVQLRGAKNAGFKAIIASLLADSPSELHNLSLISEISFAKQIISSLGGTIESLEDPHNFKIDPTGLKDYEIPNELGAKSRSSTMYIGPLLKRFGKAIVPVPGGDVAIGKRPIDRHLAGLEALGATIASKDGKYFVEAPHGLAGTTYRFAKNTHTGTETILMCAVFAKGKTILENAAEEPEVADLIKYLTAMGAKITWAGPRTLEIEGVTSLHGATHTIMNDRNEAVAFGCFALASKGEIYVKGANKEVLASFLTAVEKIGGLWEEQEAGLIFKYEKPLIATDVTTEIYPGFMTDWQPTWTALMTQATGTSLVHETVMDSRFGFVQDLQKMGAAIELFSPPISDPDQFYNFNLQDHNSSHPHAAKVFGPASLVGAEITIEDIRQGATIMLAGIIASGSTLIHDPKDQISRGYEDLVGKLTNLGAKIDVN